MASGRALPEALGCPTMVSGSTASRVGCGLLGFLLSACTFYVHRGSDLYFQGRYIEAAQVLEQTESRLTEADPVERAEYGLYRGVTLLRLGDLDGALRWL